MNQTLAVHKCTRVHQKAGGHYAGAQSNSVQDAVAGRLRFLGRHIAGQALAAGHEVTLLHRGLSNADLFAQAHHLIADRDGDNFRPLLQGQTWYVVIDTSAYRPRQVQRMAAALAGRVGHYQLVSSISAYAHFAAQGTTESAPLQTLDDPTTETVDGDTYEGLKALCEAQALAGFGARCLISRPGLLVGPHDPTGRKTEKNPRSRGVMSRTAWHPTRARLRSG